MVKRFMILNERDVGMRTNVFSLTREQSRVKAKREMSRRRLINDRQLSPRLTVRNKVSSAKNMLMLRCSVLDLEVHVPQGWRNMSQRGKITEVLAGRLEQTKTKLSVLKEEVCGREEWECWEYWG